eukprot:SAG31_NODE_15630_length_745_cov_1.603715_1_plen_198_part_10
MASELDADLESTQARMAALRVTHWRSHGALTAWGEPAGGPAISPATLPFPAGPPKPPNAHVSPAGSSLSVGFGKAPLAPLIDLPDDLLLMVLKHLSHVPDLLRVSGVCRRLHDMALHRKLWSKVEFHDDDRITPRVLHTIACRSPRMAKLRVQSCKHVNDRAIYAVASACHSLKEMDVSDCPFVTFRALNVLLGTLAE